MAIPKSKVAQQLDDKNDTFVSNDPPKGAKTLVAKVDESVIIIKPVVCHNNYVAILQTEIESAIQLAGTEGQYKNEGVVIGVGPGLSDGNGGRLPLSVNLGDYVMIGSKNHVATLMPDNGHYKGKKVVIVSENNIICEIPTDIKFNVKPW